MRYYADCSRKQQYRTKIEAEQVAEHQMSMNYGLVLRVYYCDTCHSYHLTSKPQQY